MEASEDTIFVFREASTVVVEFAVFDGHHSRRVLKGSVKILNWQCRINCVLRHHKLMVCNNCVVPLDTLCSGVALMSVLLHNLVRFLVC